MLTECSGLEAAEFKDFIDFGYLRGWWNISTLNRVAFAAFTHAQRDRRSNRQRSSLNTMVSALRPSMNMYRAKADLCEELRRS